MTSVPRWEPDGTESPVERTDPLLPAITDDVLPPLERPRLPTLDDRTLARLLAELDGEEAAPPGDRDLGASAEPATTGRIADGPTEASAHHASPLAESTRLGRSRVGETRTGAGPPSTYVRREPPPPRLPADSLTLTGLTRRSHGRTGSILFTVVFVAIFLLILVQAIVSLLTPGS